MRVPAYAKIKPITSRSGCSAAGKNRHHLLVAQALLEAQGTTQADAVARQLQVFIDGYSNAITNWYREREKSS